MAHVSVVVQHGVKLPLPLAAFLAKLAGPPRCPESWYRSGGLKCSSGGGQRPRGAPSANSVKCTTVRKFTLMKSVCICGSFRFYEEMVQLRNALQAQGVLCRWPLPGPRRAPNAMTADEARDAITHHLERIDQADWIFVFNKGGYVGNSVVMEIGYAYAQRKPVYVLVPIEDQFLMALVRRVVSIEEFLQLVHP